MAATFHLTTARKRAFDRLAEDLKRLFGPRFVTLIAYGPRVSLAFVDAIHGDDLDAMGPLVELWHRDGIATPLVMTPDEFQRSLDAFPLEYQAILDEHLVIAGRNPFDGLSVRPDDLRRACEVQAKSHLIHLRQGWLESGGHSEELAALIDRSVPSLRALLKSVARLHGVAASDTAAIARFAEDTIGLPADLVAALLDQDASPDTELRLVARLPEYLAASERLWKFIDEWPG